ncbi:BnaA01g25690D [Brassica napus]|uniref:BnaA01g25690D protein n=1 Tax=Brassica napus TaxID=3708 RepID=A0A078HWU3_BRANA|nr:BnaA01g25690D [Brassica napus]
MKDKLFFCLVQICFFSYIIRRRIQQRFPDTRDGLATNGLSISEQLGEQKSPETPKSPLPCTDFDAAYSHSYAHVRIHEEMIKASQHHSRVTVAFSSLQMILKEKKIVYAVDASDIAVQAEEVLKANGLSDKVIVLHGRVEIISFL